MKNLIMLIGLWIGILGLSPAVAEEIKLPHPPKTKVMILGSYHMGNPGLDSFNMEADDVLSDQRQAEILEVVFALSKFRPTKIALESDWGSPRTKEEYAAYLKREYELGRNEIDQIGYRLAKMMGHDTVYPVDFDWGMGRDVDWERQREVFAEHAAEINEYGEAYTQKSSESLASGTVGQHLRFINSPEMLKANHTFYSYYTIRDGEDDWYPGPHMVTNWYKRNLYIVHHLIRTAEKDGSDRILVIFGQGHAYLLKQFLEENPAFEVVDVLKYLPE